MHACTLLPRWPSASVLGVTTGSEGDIMDETVEAAERTITHIKLVHTYTLLPRSLSGRAFGAYAGNGVDIANEGMEPTGRRVCTWGWEE